MIVYKIESDGRCSGVGHQDNVYVLQEGEFIYEGDNFPVLDTLHEGDYKIQLEQQKIVAAAKTWLDDNDWKYNQHQRRTDRGTITPEQELEYKLFLDESDEKAQLIPQNN